MIFHSDILGQILYGEFLFCFLIVGFILLIAIIAAVSISVEFSKKKDQLKKPFKNPISQLDNILVYYK